MQTNGSELLLRNARFFIKNVERVSQKSCRATLNPSYFSTLLKKFTGKSYTELLMEYRIERAKDLLLLTDAKVYRVGQMVGYEDKFYFSRIFKRVTGMTPVEFKNQRREG